MALPLPTLSTGLAGRVLRNLPPTVSFRLPLAPGRHSAYSLGEIGTDPLNYPVFDTHAFVKRLTAAGMPEAQAEVLADEQVRLIDDRLATKEDIAKLQAATREDIARVHEDIAKLQAATKEDIAKLQAATKEDIAKLQASTKTDLREMELKIDAKLESAKSEIVKWMFGTIGFQTIVVVGAVVALARLAH
jgi:multidrug resistance efflux pump